MIPIHKHCVIFKATRCYLLDLGGGGTSANQTTQTASDQGANLGNRARYTQTGSFQTGDKSTYLEQGSTQVGAKGKVAGVDLSASKFSNLTINQAAPAPVVNNPAPATPAPLAATPFTPSNTVTPSAPDTTSTSTGTDAGGSAGWKTYAGLATVALLLFWLFKRRGR
jgi:hypothetical protein